VVFIHRVLLGLVMHWNWLGMLFVAIGNSVIALFVFPLLDRFQVRD
jgi:rod shape-determining protein MreD